MTVLVTQNSAHTHARVQRPAAMATTMTIRLAGAPRARSAPGRSSRVRSAAAPRPTTAKVSSMVTFIKREQPCAACLASSRTPATTTARPTASAARRGRRSGRSRSASGEESCGGKHLAVAAATVAARGRRVGRRPARPRGSPRSPQPGMPTPPRDAASRAGGSSHCTAASARPCRASPSSASTMRCASARAA